MKEFLYTIVNRPYVFAFLMAYFVLAWRLWGVKRAVTWLISGYFIAWVSEYSSININFPYGEYHYIYEHLKGELLFFGVPFFDSLSYPFLIFAGYVFVVYVLGERSKSIKPIVITLLGALLTMLLDIIIDPIATIGDKWFLGKIHYYAHPGIYFGVPFTNFAGWFFVSFAVIGFNQLLWGMFPGFFKIKFKKASCLFFAFYLSIVLFNIAITLYVKEWLLALFDILILAILMTLTKFIKK